MSVAGVEEENTAKSLQKHQVIRFSKAIKTIQFPKNGAHLADERLEIVVSRSGILDFLKRSTCFTKPRLRVRL